MPMREWFYMVRFFGVVAPLPPLMAPAMAGTGLVAAYLVAPGADRAQGALTPLLLLQMFAASSGFMVPARRGHYDLLLTAGYGRIRIAATHWVVSVLPGIVVWLAVALVDVLAAGGSAAILAGGTALAFALTSTIPWAATVALPRFTAAIAWLLALALAVAVLPPDPRAVLFNPWQASSWPVASAAVALYPVTLVGIELGAAHVPRIVPAMVLAACAMAAALAWIGRQDIPLEAPQ
jgi:hypothetical protein